MSGVGDVMFISRVGDAVFILLTSVAGLVLLYMVARVVTRAVFKSIEEYQKRRNEEFLKLKDQLQGGWPEPPAERRGKHGDTDNP